MLSKLFQVSYNMYRAASQEAESKNSTVTTRLFDYKTDGIRTPAGGCSCSCTCCCECFCGNANGNCNVCCAYSLGDALAFTVES